MTRNEDFDDLTIQDDRVATGADVNALDSEKAPLDGGGTASLTNYSTIEATTITADNLSEGGGGASGTAVSVLDYGATGDGTGNDAQAIQNALDSSAPRVYLPEGTYNIESTLDVGGTHLYGDGIGDSVLSVEAQITQAVSVNGDRGGVTDLSVYGNANTPVGVRMTGTETFCDRVESDNVTQYGTLSNTVACISAISATRCRIRDSVATRASAPNSGVARGIQLDGSGGGGALVEGNRVDDITPAADADGIVAQNGHPNSRIANNRVTNAAKSAIKVNLGAENCTVTGNTLHAGPDALAVMRIQASGTAFTGNAISVPSVSGELVRVSDAAEGAVVSGNTLELTAGAGGIEGIQVRLDEENITISGNSIYMHNTGLHGIAVGSSKNITITGNTIDECGGTGIDLNGTRGVVVNGNMIDDTADDGIRTDSSVVRGIIDGNSVDATGTDINNNSSDVVVGTNYT